MAASSDAGSVALDLGPGVGALVVRADDAVVGEELQISGVDCSGFAYRTHAIARRRVVAGATLTAAVFPSVPAGYYEVWRTGCDRVAVDVVGGVVAEVTLRPGP